MSARPRGSARLGPLALVLLTLAGCTADTAEPQGSVRFTSATCPADVSDALPDLRVTCGYLSVPELHANPQGRTVDVFVARVRGSEPVPSDPLIVIGGKDIGAPVHYADDIALMPARVGREIIVVEPRGTGHDRPSLTCPEIDGFDADYVGGSLADAEVESAFSAAVTACASSLRDRGVELSAFTLPESAADVRDLVTALGFDAFNVATYGYNSKIAFELLREAPAGLRSVYMDSPVYPDQTVFGLAVEGTRTALEAVDEACAEQPGCRRVVPSVVRTADDAVATLQRKPAVVEVAGTHLHVDGTTAARAIRDFLSFAPGLVPTVIADLASGDATDVAAYVASVRPSCFGYRLFCRAADAPAAWGEVLAILCHDEAPLVSTSLSDAATTPSLRGVLGLHPYLVACRSWPTGRSDGADEAGVSTDVPILLLHGELDPFSTPPDDAVLATMSRAYAYVFTGQSTNTLGTGEAGCAREIRAAFVADPSSPPDTTCLGTLEDPRFTP